MARTGSRKLRLEKPDVCNLKECYSPKYPYVLGLQLLLEYQYVSLHYIPQTFIHDFN